MADFPSIPTQHLTDRLASSLVDGWLAKDWLVRRLSLDYGLDCIIEPVQRGEPGGRLCYVQQKGTRGVRFDEHGRTSWPLETKHLRYYCERVMAPVFLFLVDVESECGWFCHVQGELAGAEQKLADQQTVSLSLRLDHSIRDSARLLDAVNRAIAFTREKHPGSLESSFRAAVAAHEQIDPNFSIVKAEVTGGHTCYTLAPRRPFSFSINVPADKRPTVGPKLEELFKFGRPLELTSAEAEFIGLPLFDKAKADGLAGGIKFKPDRMTACEVTLDSTQGEPFQLTLPAMLSGGTEGGLLTGKTPDAPLGLELKVTRDVIQRAGVGNIQFTWDMAAWLDKDLRSLPWVEPIARFWQALFACEDVRMTITVKGNRLVRGNFGRKKPPEIFRPHLELCELLFRAHELAVARGFQIKVPATDEGWNFDWDDIAVAYDLEVKGRHERAAPNYQATLHPAAGNTKLRELTENQPSVGGWSKLILRPYTITAFGQQLDLGDVECTAGPVTLHRVPGPTAGEYLVELRGEATTRLEMTRIPPEPSTDTPSAKE